MSEFPTLVYRLPGAHRLNGSQTYDYLPIQDDDALSAALDDGWILTLEEAVEGRREAVRGTEGPTEERAALEKEAKELGVSFNWKTSDDALLERIMAAKEPK